MMFALRNQPGDAQGAHKVEGPNISVRSFYNNNKYLYSFNEMCFLLKDVTRRR